MVFHEAAIPSVPRSIDDPVPSHEVNINGTFNVLRAAHEGKAGRVVYAASSSAYGDSEVLPKVETHAARPKSPYALQKLVGEYYCNVFSGVYGLETVALRYFNVYGPRQDPSSPYSGVLSLFMRAILERQRADDFRRRQPVARLHLCGGCRGVEPESRARGERRRQDVQRGQRRPDHAERGLGAAAEDRGRRDPAAIRSSSRAGDVRDSQADTASVVKELGHAPRFSFEEGMRHTLDWYRTSGR